MAAQANSAAATIPVRSLALLKDASSPARGFDPESRLFSSTESPAFDLPIPPGYEYMGRLEFPLKGLAWVDRHLRFKGRIDREKWIEQAKVLAAGGETEFSRRS